MDVAGLALQSSKIRMTCKLPLNRALLYQADQLPSSLPSYPQARLRNHGYSFNETVSWQSPSAIREEGSFRLSHVRPWQSYAPGPSLSVNPRHGISNHDAKG